MKTSSAPAKVLIVDDTPQNISLLNAALMDKYTIKAATRGREGIAICLAMPIDIILLDVMMPEMDGFETCRQLKENPLTRNIPVIFVTARDEITDEAMGFSCGAVDYITKPIRASIVRARVRTHLALYNQNRALENLVHEQTVKLTETRLEILLRLGSAGEYRDTETGQHVVRVCHYSRIIATAFGLPEGEAELLYHAAALHDTGKIGIPDNILFKPGKLDNAEWEIMRTHCTIGRKIIGDHQDGLLKAAASVAMTHHERWDGSGYPNGLTGNEIPLFGKIVAVADMFDALTSRRPYKMAWSMEDATKEILSCSKRSFDPDIVDTFLKVLPEITAVSKKYRDKV